MSIGQAGDTGKGSKVMPSGLILEAELGVWVDERLMFDGDGSGKSLFRF
ncbi:MAG: hypothetical protein V3V97_00215 [Hyphomicrobiaceae bacterium]